MATVANNAAPAAPAGGAYPSDEQILGIFDQSGARGIDRADDFDALPAGADRGNDSPAEHAASIPHRANSARSGSAGILPAESANAARDPRSRLEAGATNANSARDVEASNNSTQNAQQGIDAPMPEWLTRVSAADPAAAPELSALWQRSAALDAFDHAFYDGDSFAQQQLVTQLYSDDPVALRAMVAAATRLLDENAFALNANLERDSVARVRRTRGISDTNSDRRSIGNDSTIAAKTSGFSEPGLQNQSSERVNAADGNNSAAFNPAAYAQFEQSTNDAVVSDVNRAIERALDRALPNGIADGARKRIAGDTLAEVHTALRGDRQLAAQVSGALRNSQFDSATRDAITRLIVSRARGVVPEAARRVIGEWTGSVLASHRERTAKQKASSARVDVIGGALPQAVPQRAVKSSDINYRATSDEDILSW
jgi:hypothetical protein